MQFLELPLSWPYLLLAVVVIGLAVATSRYTTSGTSLGASLPSWSRDEKREGVSMKGHTYLKHLHDFPPSRRDSISTDGKLSTIEGATAGSCVPIDVPSDKVPGDMVTPTGLTMAEVRALGRFPDYAKLNGVRKPVPHPSFDLGRTLPRPYRPFRWKYYQTMSLGKMDPDWWLEVTRNYKEAVAERQKLLSQHGKEIMQFSEGSELASRETMEMAFDFLVTRYPQHFAFSSDKTIFHNHILGTSEQLHPLSDHPLRILYRNIPEDFVIMQRDHKTGDYVLRAGFIVSSVGWTLGEKFNKPLHEIHEPVPHFAEKMSASMSRFFAKMPTDAPIQRASWDFVPHRMLFALPDAPEMKTRMAGPADPPRALDDVLLRIDWQTLRRLPMSGAIVFNFKCSFAPVTDFRHEPYVPALAAKVLGEGDAEILKYKMNDHISTIQMPKVDGPALRRKLTDVLGEWAREQEAKGLTEKDWDVSTLEEHPFFPGWEKIWLERQGISA